MAPLDDMKVEVGKNLQKLNQNFSNLWRNVQNSHPNGIARLFPFPPGSSSRRLNSAAKTIGQTVHDLKSKSSTAITSSVSGVMEEFNTLRRNVELNVKALRSGGGTAEGGTIELQTTSSSSSSAGPPTLSFPMSKRDILAGAVSPQVDNQTAPPESLEQQQQPLSSPSSSLPSPSSSPPEEVPEEDPHPDLSSVSATSVFSIGYLGPPLLGPRETDGFVFSNEEVPKIGDEMGQEGRFGGPVPVLTLEDVRRSIGKALIMYKKIRGLGFRRSSWENKMPWRNPRPTSLAKGMKWPQQKFSSVRERHEYHRRARRRGRYLIGPTPGWSWFAADIIFLYFLVNNPAGNFLI